MSSQYQLFKNKSLLIVEDDVIMQEETAGLLEIFFDKVWTADNGVEGVSLYQEHHPDIIVTDISMPQMDGFEMIEYIRANDKLIPISILSSHSEKEVLLQALNISIDSYILKPITLENILSALLKAFERNTHLDRNICLSQGVCYNLISGELTVEGKLIKLGIKERELLNYFVSQKDSSISKEQLIDKIWPLDDISDSALKSLLYRLRKKVGTDVIVSTHDNMWKLIHYSE